MPWRASIDDPALTDFSLKRHKLLIRPSGRWPIDNSDLTRLQQRMVRFEQIGAANGVDQHHRIFDRSPFKVRALAMATDLNANHARTKCLKQHLGVGRVATTLSEPGSYRAACAIAQAAVVVLPAWRAVSARMDAPRGALKNCSCQGGVRYQGSGKPTATGSIR
jgi:hypothetical protein